MNYIWIFLVVTLVAAFYIIFNLKSENPIISVEKNSQQKEFEIPEFPETYKHKILTYVCLDPGDKYSSINGMAVFEDGSVLRYSDQKTVKIDNEFKTIETELDWRLEAKIKKEGIAGIMTLLNNFVPDLKQIIDKKGIIQIFIPSGSKQGYYFIEDDQSPNGFQLFTEVNRLISINTIAGAVMQE